MSWRFIFNSTVGDKWWDHIDNAKDAAKNAGYKFFSWNGWIYSIDGKQINIKVEDCF